MRDSGKIVMDKGDIIKDGEKYFSVLCVLGSVVYVKQIFDVNDTRMYMWEEVLKQYLKIEIMKK